MAVNPLVLLMKWSRAKRQICRFGEGVRTWRAYARSAPAICPGRGRADGALQGICRGDGGLGREFAGSMRPTVRRLGGPAECGRVPAAPPFRSSGNDTRRAQRPPDAAFPIVEGRGSPGAAGSCSPVPPAPLLRSRTLPAALSDSEDRRVIPSAQTTAAFGTLRQLCVARWIGYGSRCPDAVGQQ